MPTDATPISRTDAHLRALFDGVPTKAADLSAAITQSSDELSGLADRVAKLTSLVNTARVEFAGGIDEALEKGVVFSQTMRGRIDMLAHNIEDLEASIFGFRPET